ncbi:Anthranilate synthase component 1 [Nitrosopumilaceae archaeon]|nr:Anthranilate synthase component 1 [Nitrosopumilaceae archaeon]
MRQGRPFKYGGAGRPAWVDAFGELHTRRLDTGEDQFQTYSRLSRGHDHSFLFESLSGPGDLAETSVMGFDPRVIFRGYADRAEITEAGSTRVVDTGDPLSVLRGIVGRVDGGGRRYAGGAVGAVSYGAARLEEEIPDSHPEGIPLMEFGIYDDGIIFDAGGAPPEYFWRGEDRLDELGLGAGDPEPFRATEPVPEIDEAGFSRMVDSAKKYVHDGDVFQVVLSRRYGFEASGDGLDLYGALRRTNPSPYMYHLRQGGSAVVGASPEMLVRVTGERVETFPIAGTRPSGSTAREGDRLAAELLADEKEIAEHTMLVDLGRNDIGRVCTYGTVRPESLMEVRRFSHVQHIVTHLAGRLAPGRDMYDAFRSVFPAGTVTGAPKVRAMEIIDELEPRARGRYAGAVGYFSASGCCDFAIAIRSIFLGGGRGYVQAGAGIVSDSDPGREFAETEHKAGAMLDAIREASG